MTSTTLCRDLASVPAIELSRALHTFLSDAVCELFKNQEDLNSTPKDQVILKDLVSPLQWMLFGGDPNIVLATFENQGPPSNFCGKVFKSGEPAYFCK